MATIIVPSRTGYSVNNAGKHAIEFQQLTYRSKLPMTASARAVFSILQDQYNNSLYFRNKRMLGNDHLCELRNEIKDQGIRQQINNCLDPKTSEEVIKTYLTEEEKYYYGELDRNEVALLLLAKHSSFKNQMKLLVYTLPHFDWHRKSEWPATLVLMIVMGVGRLNYLLKVAAEAAAPILKFPAQLASKWWNYLWSDGKGTPPFSGAQHLHPIFGAFFLAIAFVLVVIPSYLFSLMLHGISNAPTYFQNMADGAMTLVTKLLATVPAFLTAIGYTFKKITNKKLGVEEDAKEEELTRTERFVQFLTEIFKGLGREEIDLQDEKAPWYLDPYANFYDIITDTVKNFLKAALALATFKFGGSSQFISRIPVGGPLVDLLHKGLGNLGSWFFNVIAEKLAGNVGSQVALAYTGTLTTVASFSLYAVFVETCSHLWNKVFSKTPSLMPVYPEKAADTSDLSPHVAGRIKQDNEGFMTMDPSQSFTNERPSDAQPTPTKADPATARTLASHQAALANIVNKDGPTTPQRRDTPPTPPGSEDAVRLDSYGPAESPKHS